MVCNMPYWIHILNNILARSWSVSLDVVECKNSEHVVPFSVKILCITEYISGELIFCTQKKIHKKNCELNNK